MTLRVEHAGKPKLDIQYIDMQDVYISRVESVRIPEYPLMLRRKKSLNHVGPWTASTPENVIESVDVMCARQVPPGSGLFSALEFSTSCLLQALTVSTLNPRQIPHR